MAARARGEGLGCRGFSRSIGRQLAWQATRLSQLLKNIMRVLGQNVGVQICKRERGKRRERASQMQSDHLVRLFPFNQGEEGEGLKCAPGPEGLVSRFEEKRQRDRQDAQAQMRTRGTAPDRATARAPFLPWFSEAPPH